MRTRCKICRGWEPKRHAQNKWIETPNNFSPLHWKKCAIWGFYLREWAINLLLITSMFWAHSNTYYRWWRSCVTCRQRRRFQSFYILKEFSCLRLEDMKEVVKRYIALCEGFTKLTHLDSIAVSLFVNNETAVLSKNVWSLQQMAPDMCLR